MKPGNLIDIIERSQARRALQEEREPNNFQAVIVGAVARLGPDKNGRTGKDGFGVEKLRVFTAPDWDGHSGSLFSAQCSGFWPAFSPLS